MKNVLLTLIFILSLNGAHAQDSTKVVKLKKHNNELGMDITNLIKQFINFNSSPNPSYYTPQYYLLYRRHFKHFNIRFKAGGTYFYTSMPTPYENDPLRIYINKKTQIDLLIGAESFSRLADKWQAFYGFDYRRSYSKTYNDAQYWNGGYSHGYKITATIEGYAPFLGIKFSPSPRLHISTELNAIYTIQKSDNRVLQHPVDPGYPVLPDPDPVTDKKDFFEFFEPVFLILSFDI